MKGASADERRPYQVVQGGGKPLKRGLAALTDQPVGSRDQNRVAPRSSGEVSRRPCHSQWF